jgi:hypothetical protein
MRVFALAILCSISTLTTLYQPSAMATDRSGQITGSMTLYPGDAWVSSNGRFRLVFQNDSNLVLFDGTKPIWDPSIPKRLAKTRDTVTVHNWVMTPDGPVDQPLTSTPLGNDVPSRVVFQTDGNLVVYVKRKGVEEAVWDPSTYGNPGAVMNVQDDGNVVILSAAGRPLWATNTCCR